jgi:hypothetical protein
MGFVNVGYGLRAIGYLEPDPLPAGPVALVTQSGSVFSAMLRTRRALGYTVVVSSGQELVTTAAQYARYALDLPQTRVLASCLRHGTPLCCNRCGGGSRPHSCGAWAGRSAAGRAPVPRIPGAGQAGRGMEVPGRPACTGSPPAELTDTLELFTIGRRRPWSARRDRHGADPGLNGRIADLRRTGVPFGQTARYDARLAQSDPGWSQPTR